MTLFRRSVKGSPGNAADHDGNVDHFDNRTRHLINVADYGAVGDGVEDDTAAIQAAIDAAWSATVANKGSYRVQLPPGTYKITDSIRLFQNNGTTFTFTSFSFGGDARGYVNNRKTVIKPTFTDKPAIIVQAARGTKLSYFSVQGSANNFTLPSYANLLDDESDPWWNTGAARDQTYSPYCGIAIDPFGVSEDENNQYPGLDYYNKGTQGSTEVFIEEVECQGFIVGICINPSEATQLGDSITLRHCNLSYNRVACSVGQSQNRGVVLENCHVKAAQVAIDTTLYGQGNGPFPNVIGGVWVFIKWLISGNSGWGQGAITNLYTESLWSLGFWGQASGGFPFSFNECHIKFVTPDDGGGGKQSDAHLNAGGPVIFNGGYVGYYKNNYRRLSMFNSAKLVFNNVCLDGEPVVHSRELLSMNDCTLRYSGQGTAYGIQMLVRGSDVAVPGNAYIPLPPDARVVTLGMDEWTAGAWDVVAGDSSLTITANGDGTGSFTSSNPGRYFVGAYVAPLEAWTGAGPAGALGHSYRRMSIGRVASISGSTINLAEMPISFTTGSYTPYLWRLPTYKPRSIGTTTSGSADITNVSPVASWNVGDRINGNGIPVGATIAAKSGTTLTMNVNATASGTVAIWDASMTLTRSFKSAAPTTGVWFRGDRVLNSAPSAGGVEGWVCTATGEPGTWKAFGEIAP
jgi:hypothetical protein